MTTFFSQRQDVVFFAFREEKNQTAVLNELKVAVIPPMLAKACHSNWFCCAIYFEDIAACYRQLH
jgi:hypothetical protein